MKFIRTWLPLLAVLFLLGACASTGVSRKAAARTGPEPGLYGVRGDALVHLDVGGAIGEASAELEDVSALTYDPYAGRFYGIADASSQPALIAVDAATGEATRIGVIDVVGLELTLVEAIAYHPVERTLYAAGGKSAYASTVLFTVDPETAEGQQAARIRGTMQDEVDAMTFAGDVLYAADGAGGSSAIYRLDLITGQASRVGKSFAGTVTDLAFDPATRRLIGTSGAGEPLIAFSLGDGNLAELPAAGEPVRALAFVTAPGAVMFGDGFESGDASAWSKTAGKQRR